MATPNAYLNARATLARDRVITRRMLWMLGACEGQRELFTKTFGPNARVTLTEDTARRAADAGLNLFWLGNILIDTTPARVVWEQQLSKTWHARDDAENTDYALYLRGAIAWDEYMQRCDVHRDMYLQTTALALLHIYTAQEANRERTPS